MRPTQHQSNAIPRTRRRRFALPVAALAAMFISVAACGAPGASASDRLARDLDGLASEACACSDVACAQGVKKRVVAAVKNQPTPPDVAEWRMRKAVQQMSDCMTAVNGAGR